MTNDRADGLPDSQPQADADNATDQRQDAAPFSIVGIGASAGGLEAFTQLLRALPPTSPDGRSS